MKKAILLAITVVFLTGSYAQKGFYAGAQFAYNSTWLMNAQVFDDGAEQDIDVSWGHYYGLVLGYDFGEKIGVEVDFNSNKITQKYVGDIDIVFTDNDDHYTAQTTLKSFDIPVMAKFGDKSYFEIGPVFQIVNRVNYVRTFEDINYIGIYKDLVYTCTDANMNVTDEFKKFGMGIGFGFGSDISLINDALFLNFGVRFQYTITDLQGVNGLGLNIDSNFVPTDNQDGNNEKDRFKTNPLVGGFKIGLRYKFQQ